MLALHPETLDPKTILDHSFKELTGAPDRILMIDDDSVLAPVRARRGPTVYDAAAPYVAGPYTEVQCLLGENARDGRIPTTGHDRYPPASIIGQG